MAHFVRKHDVLKGGRSKDCVLFFFPLTAVSTHEEHHFSVYNRVVKLNTSRDTIFSCASSFLSLFKIQP